MKKIYILAAATLALAACDKNEDTPFTSTIEARITATIDDPAGSRAVDMQWGERDEIGITTTFQSKVGPFINFKYTTEQGDGIFSGNKIYIYNPMSVTAYYPFKGIEGTAPGIITASTTADKQTAEEQPYIDFLFAHLESVDTDNPDVNLNFAHKMSKISFIFIDGNEGTEVSKIITYSIGQLKLEGTFDTATGICAAQGDPKELEINFSEGSVKNEEALPSLIVFPQELATMTLTIKDNQDQYYSCNLSIADGQLKEGNNYLFKITVSKKGLSLQKSTISKWITEESEGEASSSDDD